MEPPPLPRPPVDSGPGVVPAPRQRKRYSAGRQVARFAVWAIFLAVLAARLIWHPERDDRPRFGRGPGGGEFGQFDGGRRGRRPPTPVAKPLSEVPPTLLRIEIQVADADADTLRGYFWRGWGGGGGGQEERPQVKAVVREGGLVHSNVALQLKGSAGSFRPFDDKPAMTLNFSKHEKGREFHGHRKLSLNNSVQDATYLHEILCREIYTAAGVPAPRADHATVILNGRDLGLYVLTEGWGKPFVRRHFPDDGGNLYDGGFVQDIDGALTVASGDDEDDHRALERLIAVIRDAEGPDGLWEKLGTVLDRDRFLTLLALDVLTCNWDGYAMNRNNYRVFHDRSTDRMVFLPHGLDQMFGEGRRMGTDAPIVPAPRGAVARAVLATPEGRQGYLARLAVLRTNVLREELLIRRVGEVAARIGPTLAAYHPAWAEQHDRAVAHLVRRIGERLRSVDAQLADPPVPPEFDAGGRVRLTRWQPRRGNQDAGAAEAVRTEADGLRVLRLAAGPQTAAGSWRTRLVLDPGRYRLEGRVRLRGNPGAVGAGLRVSGYRFQQVIEPADTWTPARFRLAVDEPWTEVELVAEFAGTDGHAEFDEESLVLVREP